MIATDTTEDISLYTPFPSMIVSDAFEAVTNGMNNPEALEQLQQSDNPETAEWRNIIQAIQAFYKQDFSEVDAMLKSVSDDSIAGSLKYVIYHMSGMNRGERKLSRLEEKLAKRITENSRFLSSALNELKESIEYGEDLFAETAALLIKEVKQKTPTAAEKLALWSFRICMENDFNDEALADNILMLFGQAEGLRLIALSLIEYEPESALICFSRSLIKKLDDKTADRTETIGYLDIIEALTAACPENDPVLLDITELFSMMESELNLFFNLDPMPHNGSPLMKIAGIKQKIAGEPTREPDIEKSCRPPAPLREVVQLELF